MDEKELRESIARTCYQFANLIDDALINGRWERLHAQDKERWYDCADFIISLFKQHIDLLTKEKGYVKLSDDQSLPKIPPMFPPADQGAAIAQSDMLKAGFRRIKQ